LEQDIISIIPANAGGTNYNVPREGFISRRKPHGVRIKTEATGRATWGPEMHVQDAEQCQ
jgi:hypothetical protein